MNQRARFLAFLTIVLWASSFAGTRVSILGGYTPTHLALVRFLVASVSLFIYICFKNELFQKPSKSHLIRIVVLGWIGITIYHLGLTFGVKTVTAGTAAMIVGSAPIFTALIAALFLKEPLTRTSWISLIIGLIGIMIITYGTSDATFSLSIGAIYLILATLSVSVFFVLQKPLFQYYHPITLTAFFTWAGTLPMFIFTPGLWTTISQATLEANLSAVFIGIFPTAIAYAIWAVALSLAPGQISLVASMIYIEPVIAIFIAWIWLKEWPSLVSLIGGAIAISSVLIINFANLRKRYAKQE